MDTIDQETPSTRTARIEETLRIQRDVSIALGGCDDIPEALSLILDAALHVKGVDSGGIYIAWPDGSLDLVVHEGLSAAFVEQVRHYEADAPQTELARSGRALYDTYRRIAPGHLTEEQGAEGIRGLAVIPVMRQDRLLAVLNLASHAHDEIPAAARDALETMAQQVGSALTRIHTATALRESRHNLESLFETVDDFLFVLDEEARILKINPAVTERLGFSEDELRGRNVLDVHPANRREEARTIVQGMLAGTADFCPVPLQAKDGHLIPVETRVTTGVWAGRPAIFGLSRDITKRKRAEDGLRVQRDLSLDLSGTDDTSRALRCVLDAALKLDWVDSGGVYVTDESGGLYLTIHSGLGSDFIQKNSYFPDDSPNSQWARDGKTYAGVYSEMFGEKDHALAQESLRGLISIPVLRHGALLAVLNLASHVDPEPPVETAEALEAIAQQIGSSLMRLRADQALRDSRRDFQALFDTVDDFLFVLDGTGRIIKVNDVTYERLGYSADELLGRTVLEIHPKERREEAAATVAAMIAGECDYCPIPLETKSGGLIPVETRVTAGTWLGQPALFGLSRDVSARQATEGELEGARVRLAATTAAAGELRTLLASDEGRPGGPATVDDGSLVRLVDEILAQAPDGHEPVIAERPIPDPT